MPAKCESCPSHRTTMNFVRTKKRGTPSDISEADEKGDHRATRGDEGRRRMGKSRLGTRAAAAAS